MRILVESLFFDPTVLRIFTDYVLSNFIVAKDDQRKRKRNEQPAKRERREVKHSVHSRSVDQQESQNRLKDQSEVQRSIFHGLFENRTLSSFADDQSGPLTDDDRKKVARLTSVLQFLPLFVVLYKKRFSLSKVKKIGIAN